MNTKSWIVIPCYNKEEVLLITSELLLKEFKGLIGKERLSKKNRILFVNDRSKDRTWEVIKNLSQKDEYLIDICQSRNRGYQNAVLEGLMKAKNIADITIFIDCDGQGDISVMEEMVDEYHNGCKMVYGVRSRSL